MTVFPNDILRYIFSYVPALQLFSNCTLVCSHWNQVINFENRLLIQLLETNSYNKQCDIRECNLTQLREKYLLMMDTVMMDDFCSWAKSQLDIAKWMDEFNSLLKRMSFPLKIGVLYKTADILSVQPRYNIPQSSEYLQIKLDGSSSCIIINNHLNYEKNDLKMCTVRLFKTFYIYDMVPSILQEEFVDYQRPYKISRIRLGEDLTPIHGNSFDLSCLTRALY